MKFGDDKALSLGGTLPQEPVNGLLGIYPRLCDRSGDTVYAVVALRADYVKVYSLGESPDEPVLRVVAVEPVDGDDEATLTGIMSKRRAARTRDRDGGQQQVLDTGPRRDFAAWMAEQELPADSDTAAELTVLAEDAWTAARADTSADYGTWWLHYGQGRDETAAELARQAWEAARAGSHLRAV